MIQIDAVIAYQQAAQSLAVTLKALSVDLADLIRRYDAAGGPHAEAAMLLVAEDAISTLEKATPLLAQVVADRAIAEQRERDQQPTHAERVQARQAINGQPNGYRPITEAELQSLKT